MKRLTLLALSAVAAMFATPAWAAGPPATLADLSWMVGSWEGPGIDGAPSAESYSPAAGGAMPGHFRQLNADGTVMFYELITFVEEEGSLVLKLKHFNADLTGWEEKGDVASFPLTEVGANRWAFGGIVYERTGEDAMDVDVAMRHSDGSRSTLEFRFTRVR